MRVLNREYVIEIHLQGQLTFELLLAPILVKIVDMPLFELIKDQAHP